MRKFACHLHRNGSATLVAAAPTQTVAYSGSPDNPASIFSGVPPSPPLARTATRSLDRGSTGTGGAFLKERYRFGGETCAVLSMCVCVFVCANSGVVAMPSKSGSESPSPLTSSPGMTREMRLFALSNMCFLGESPVASPRGEQGSLDRTLGRVIGRLPHT